MTGRISELPAYTAFDVADIFEFVDVSNTSEAATGTNTRATLAQLRTFMQTGITVQQKFERLWGVGGTLAVATGVARLYFPRACTIVNLYAFVQTAPTGASVIVDANKNGGTTIFTTQANRPTIAAGTRIDLTAVPDVTSLAAGDWLTFDVDQIGSTVAGADLTVAVVTTEAIS